MTSVVRASVADPASRGSPPAVAARRSFSAAALDAAADAGDAVALAILRFSPEPVASVETGSAAQTLTAATAEFMRGNLERGAGLLMPLLSDETHWVWALGCFAEACVRLDRYDDALALATACLVEDPNEPRLLFVAGLCELKRGNRKAAQMLLAKCSRIARKLPDHADDLRAAQSLLLKMHFG